MHKAVKMNDTMPNVAKGMGLKDPIFREIR